MRIKEAKDLQTGFITRAITAHTRRVEEEVRRCVAFDHRQQHINRVLVLANAVSDRLTAVNNRIQRIAISECK